MASTRNSPSTVDTPNPNTMVSSTDASSHNTCRLAMLSLILTISSNVFVFFGVLFKIEKLCYKIAGFRINSSSLFHSRITTFILLGTTLMASLLAMYSFRHRGQSTHLNINIFMPPVALAISLLSIISWAFIILLSFAPHF